MAGSLYKGTITILPDGRVYTGSHENTAPQNQKLYAKIQRPKTGLAAKVTPMQDNTLALYEKIVDDNLSLSAATIIANSENISHLQLIRLFEKAQGDPDVYFHMDNMYVRRDIPGLDLRETFYDTTQDVEYLGRLEEAKTTKTEFDEIEYNLKKLVGKVYTPVEDIMRTMINPNVIDLGQISWGMQRRRNQEAINELEKIGNVQPQLDSPADVGSNYHSINNTGNDLLEIFKNFLLSEDVSIDHIAMSPTMYANYTSNTWTNNGGPTGIAPERLPSGGVVSLPGMPGITAVVDAMITNDTVMYAINKLNALRLGQGPVIMRRYFDEEKDAEVVKKTDFNQYISVNDQLKNMGRKFGMTIPFALPATA